MVIDTYEIEIQYRKGILHTNADSMSRVPWRTHKSKREDCPYCTTQSSCSGDEKGKKLPVRACSAHTDKRSSVHIRPCSVSGNQDRSDNTAGAGSSSSSCLNSQLDRWLVTRAIGQVTTGKSYSWSHSRLEMHFK